MTDFDEKLTTFITGINRIIKDANLAFPTEVRRHGGKRYIKLVSFEQHTPGGEWEAMSIHTFVDTTNGDVLKPASYKNPAKHARGNIFDAHNGLATMSWTGPAYLR